MAKYVQPFESIDADAAPAVGGKGMNLGVLTRAGLPVPPGFCITSEAYRRALAAASAEAEADAAAEAGLKVDHELRDQVLAAYRALGGGLVAVRSSATFEDGSAASFAGQQETFLGIQGDDALIDAVERCWSSLHTQRGVAYRRRQDIDESGIAMAVVVQRLVASDVSGVLFTHDPLDRHGRTMLIEAARGLGEAVVSGAVMPDRFHTDRQTGALVDQQVHTQRVMHTVEGVRELDEHLRDAPCLDAQQLAELTAMGRRIESHYGEPRDVEWALADGRVYVLQARPITAAAAYEQEAVRREEIAALAAMADPSNAPGPRGRGTVWARYNLAEVLPDPTPMTWSIVRRFMSGRGGFGLMYRDLGFDPDPCLDDEGFIDLICGRPYVNLSREPKLYFRDFPYGYPFERLKADPQRAIYPTPEVDPAGATARLYLRLPMILFHMLRAGRRMAQQRRTHAARLTQQVFPRFVERVNAARATDLSKLSPQHLLDRVHEWVQCTLVDFARESLRPSMFAATALAELEKGLATHVGPERAAAQAQALMTGVRPDADCDLASAVKALEDGTLSHDQFLARFGHRGSHEMELAHPRWSEDPTNSPIGRGRPVSRPVEGSNEVTAPAAPPATADHERLSAELWPALAQQLNLSASQTRATERALRDARTYLALRESAKHHLMMGYAIIRAALVEIGRRFGFKDDVFFLELGELPQLIEGADLQPLHERARRRRKRRQLALSLHTPQVLFSDDLEAIGRPIAVQGAAEWKGTPVSFGVYEGTALVLDEPAPAERFEPGFVLVCPSTDPAWVPLFLHAKALVMETGGVLSHGAIVAREFGLPAVAGIPDVHRRIRTGQRLRVDGTSGIVHVFDGGNEQ